MERQGLETLRRAVRDQLGEGPALGAENRVQAFDELRVGEMLELPKIGRFMAAAYKLICGASQRHAESRNWLRTRAKAIGVESGAGIAA